MLISPIYTILLISVLFFALIPGVGAFVVRSRWRIFRKRVIRSSLLPMIGYREIRERRLSAYRHDEYRFIGNLEAIQGDSTMWLRSGATTIAVDMTHSDIYLLPRHATDVPDEPPRRTVWRQIGSMTEGSKVFVSGRLVTEGGHATLRGDTEEPVLAVFYDGPEETLLRRSIWSGRQLNEYWNQLTPGALAGGTLALIIVAYVLMRSPVGRSAAIISLSLASAPLLPLLPPGVLLFFLYRWTWRRGRTFRAHRDVLRLPLRHLPDGEVYGVLPEGQSYCLRYVDEDAANQLEQNGAVRLLPPLPAVAGEFAVFAHPGVDGLEPPPDPLSELTIVPGNPDLLAVQCQQRARRLEVISSVILGIGLIVNLYLVFLGLQMVLR